LGKSLFWDQQVGSDGQACASCHFSAGADARTRNAISPGLNATPIDHSYSAGGYTAPNSTLAASDFPAHRLANADDRTSAVLRDTNDVVGSAGVFFRTFTAVGAVADYSRPVASVPDTCTSVADPDGFQVGGTNVRRVEPRNTPTMFNALFNNRNFWDGRAQDVFNGVDPFGARSASAVVYDSASGKPTPLKVRIAFSSLASQAVGPPLSKFEMSCDGRTFPDLGHKLLRLRPLALQEVAPSDSVLAAIKNDSGRGLRLSYAALIERAFAPRWWDSRTPVVVNGRAYTQAEANFSLFWGLAVQAYMQTLVADDTPVDRFFEGRRGALTPSQLRGMNIFQSFQGQAPNPFKAGETISVKLSTGAPADARCSTCHGGAETTIASVSSVQDERLERMTLRNGACAMYDQGFVTTGVRPLAEDVAVSGLDPAGQSFAETALAQEGLLASLVPTAASPYGLSPLLGGTVNCEGQNIAGAFKTPQLRNVELTGPYFHNGGQLTVMQVVDFYNRGGDFDNDQVDENIRPLGLAEQDKVDLVNFLMALTDERVAYERAPFDHPSLCVADGQTGDSLGVGVAAALPGGGGQAIAIDRALCIDAVGARGRPTRLTTFLGVSPLAH
jgi:cytochrome c peroxidase